MNAEEPRKRTRIRLDARSKLFVVGALLAAALFLVEAGIAEISIAVDQECRESIAAVRLAPDPFDVCASEWQWYLVRATSRGFAWVVNQDVVPIVGWLTMGLIYALLGGVSAQVFRGRGLLVFILAQAGLIATCTGLGYFSQFIA